MSNGEAPTIAPIDAVEAAVKRVMEEETPPQTMSELGARLELEAGDVSSSVRRLVIQQLLSDGKLALSEDRALSWS